MTEPTPQTGTFPPSGPTTLTSLGQPGSATWVGSYLYQEYADDDDLQAFVAAFNSFANQYDAFFATIMLPVYTNPLIVGALLDWVALGIYGMIRPSLSSGRNLDVGPFNTTATTRWASTSASSSVPGTWWRRPTTSSSGS